jgi:hypothetical protein
MGNAARALRQRLLTSGFLFALAAAPIAVGMFAVQPAQPVAQCTSGEENDVFTSTCTPMLTPNTGGFTTTAANPDVPEVDGIPCVGGRSSAACFGLLEDQQAAGPPAIPRSTISASP